MSGNYYQMACVHCSIRDKIYEHCNGYRTSSVFIDPITVRFDAIGSAWSACLQANDVVIFCQMLSL